MMLAVKSFDIEANMRPGEGKLRSEQRSEPNRNRKNREGENRSNILRPEPDPVL